MGQFRKVLFWSGGRVGEMESKAISASNLKLKLTEAELGNYSILDHIYVKINRNTVNMSYRTTPNFKKMISAHNAKILNQKTPDPPCNCTEKDSCPLDGNCRASNLVYQATLKPQRTPLQLKPTVG